MGFWGALLNTSVSVAYWVTNNSGVIVKATSTIAQVARLIPLTAEEQAGDEFLASLGEGHSSLPMLVRNSGRAEKALTQYANDPQKFPSPPGERTPRGPFYLTGLWEQPAGNEGKPPPDCVADIHRFFAIHRLQHTYRGVDIGQEIAEGLFNDDRSPDAPPEEITDHKVSAGGENYSIQGYWSWYEVPLGNAEGHVAWHGVLKIWEFTDDSGRAEIAKLQQQTAVRLAPSASEPAKGSYNATSLCIQWNGARGVGEVMSRAINSVTENSDIRLAVEPFVEGTRFTYHFEHPLKLGPNELLGKVSAAIGRSAPKPPPEQPLPRMPALSIAHAATIVVEESGMETQRAA